MLKNLLVISFRNFSKEKAYTLVNILGLTLGLTCSLFLILYIRHEVSFDKYHANANNIYRVVSHITEPDNEFTWAIAQIPLTQELLEKYPDVENATRFFGRGRQLYKRGDLNFFEERTFLADSTVFEVFTYKMISGDAKTALNRPNTIVLTESMANKYFGDEDPIGQTIVDGRNESLEVTGVIEDVPSNSHFIFDALVSRITFPDFLGSWGNFGVSTYIVLPDGYNPEDMQKNFAMVLEEHVNPIFESIGITVEYQLQPIKDIHLRSKIQDEAESGGDMSYIYIFTAVAIFMLVIACINYMNLATARSAKRAKEVGIRKVAGSHRSQIIVQFIAESMVLAFLAMITSIVLVYFFLPQFNTLSGKSLNFYDILQPDLIIGLLLVTIIVGIISGSYPALYLSGFKPTEVLTAVGTPKGGSQVLRKSLVVFQFFISISMLISTLIVYDQLTFLRNKDLGFDQSQVLRIELNDREVREKYPVLRNSLLELPDVVATATSNNTPGSNVGKLIATVEDNQGEMIERGVDLFSADFDFVNTLGMSIVAGRDFSREFMSDTSGAALVNEAMVKRMSWDEPLGKRFQFGDSEDDLFRVIGVIKDYHQNSLYDVIEPLFIYNAPNQYFMFIKVESGEVSNTISSIESIWKEVATGAPFEYTFLDEDFNSQYEADQKRGKIFTIFSILTILIACLGLFGLASYSTERRTKEIGIRKAIGSGVSGIVLLVSKEFAILNLISILFALPVAYYFMDRWLQSFSYRIQMINEIGTFIFAIVLALLITMVSVGYHTLRAALSNPVNSLREQ